MRILISSTQYPYHGGAATNAYAIIKELRKKGHSVCGLFFEKSSANCDPDKIGGIVKSGNKYNKTSVKKMISKYLKGEPEIILAKNYAAPVYCKSIYPNVKVIYLVSGSPMMIPASKSRVSACKLLRADKDNVKKICGVRHNSSELAAIKKSDAIILNSVISKDIFLKIYSNYLKNKVVFPPLDTSYIAQGSKNKSISFKKRQIDIIFVCSNFSRDVKNAQFAKKLFLHKSMLGKKKLVIGGGYKMFSGVPNLTARGKIKHSSVLNYLGRSRLAICTSYFDASPNVIREALSSGCNILVSKNCGWSEKYPTRSVCRDVYSVSEWARKAQYLIENKVKYEDVQSQSRAMVNLENYMLKTIVS